MYFNDDKLIKLKTNKFINSLLSERIEIMLISISGIGLYVFNHEQEKLIISENFLIYSG